MKQELSPNTTLSHYRIVAKIGAGWLGEVWLAEDTRLRRFALAKMDGHGMSGFEAHDSRECRRYPAW